VICFVLGIVGGCPRCEALEEGLDVVISVVIEELFEFAGYCVEQVFVL
jgi:hypothetical protein